MTTRRSFTAGALGAAAAITLPSRSGAQSGGSFSVSGRNGPFVRQVAGRRFGGASGDGGSLGLASDAINQGAYQQARLRMPQTEAAVSGLLAQLGGQWPYGRGPAPRVFIVGIDYYNAYSLPDNSIVVSFGLLDHAGSDDEVAFVLGHEYSHLLLGHFAGAADARRNPETAGKLGQLFLVGAALSSVGGWSGAAGAAAREAGATGDLLQFVSATTAEQPHSQRQEDEADALGFDLALAASFAAEDAAATVFDTIQADRVRRSAAEEALRSQLKSQLSQAVGRDVVNSVLSGGLSTSNLRQSLFEGGARLALGAATSRNQGPAHRPPAERKKGIAEYSETAYPSGAPLREVQRAWLQRVRASAEFGQARTAVTAVAEAMKARTAGDYPTAGQRIGVALASGYGGAPLVLCEAGRLRADMGDPTGADRMFSQADASPDQTVDGAVDHGRMLYRAGLNDRALELIDTSAARFGDEKPFAALKIATLRQAGRQGEADDAYARCQTWSDDGLRRDCALAAGKTEEPKSQPSLPHIGFPGIPHF